MIHYPEGPFFVAHRLFKKLRDHPKGVWGDILDGPVTDDDAVIAAIREAFKDELAAGDIPDRRDLRVWIISQNWVSKDCTAWAVGELERLAEYGVTAE